MWNEITDIYEVFRFFFFFSTTLLLIYIKKVHHCILFTFQKNIASLKYSKWSGNVPEYLYVLDLSSQSSGGLCSVTIILLPRLVAKTPAYCFPGFISRAFPCGTTLWHPQLEFEQIPAFLWPYPIWCCTSTFQKPCYVVAFLALLLAKLLTGWVLSVETQRYREQYWKQHTIV